MWKISKASTFINFKSRYVWKILNASSLEKIQIIEHLKKFYSSLFGKLPETQTATPKQLLRTMTGQLLPFIHYSKQETSQKKV